MYGTASFEVVKVSKTFLSEMKMLKKSQRPWTHKNERSSPAIFTPEVLSPGYGFFSGGNRQIQKQKATVASRHCFQNYYGLTLLSVLTLAV